MDKYSMKQNKNVLKIGKYSVGKHFLQLKILRQDVP